MRVALPARLKKEDSWRHTKMSNDTLNTTADPYLAASTFAPNQALEPKLLDTSKSKLEPPYLLLKCGNCDRPGHEARDCVGPVDENGYLAACPLCNRKNHIYDDCRERLALFPIPRDEVDQQMLLYYRQNKPSIRARRNWVDIYNERHPALISLPWTPTFALSQQRLESGIKWRTGVYQNSWQSYTYEHIDNPDREARYRVKDPNVDDLAKRRLTVAQAKSLTPMFDLR